MKVLIIEDDIIIRSLLKVKINRLFRTMPIFDITTADTFNKGLELLESFAPDIVILDLGLDDSETHETINQLQRITSKAVVIIVSGYLDENIIGTCFKEGAYDVIDKMVLSSSLLKDKIERAYYKHLNENLVRAPVSVHA